MPKLVRITTVPISLLVLLKGQMKFMKQNGFDVTMISSDGEEVEKLINQEECPHIPVKLTRKITPVTDLISLIKLVFILKKIKPDIVHTHTPKAGLIGMWAAKIAGVPIRLHTIAGLPWMETSGIKRKLLITIEKITAMAAVEIFPNSYVQKQFLFENNIGKKKLKVIGSGSSNGIDSEYFSINDDNVKSARELKLNQNIQDDSCVWIFVGRIVKDKGIMELMDSFLELIKEFPQDRLWLVGNEEPDLDPLEKNYRELLHHHYAIKWWGYQIDIRPSLAASKVLVFPSYREGFPNVPLQAGAMGCMLLLSDINGCNEIVNNGVDGILVPVKDSNALAKAMIDTRKNIERTDYFASQIKEKIKSSYNQKKIWNLILNEYTERLKK
jgi:glycosyltransferase involved in cell wall biosynthesis